jgi:hypothetical protein
MAPLIRYFGYLTLLAYGRAPAPPLRLVHARLSEYRNERDVGKRLSTQKGRARIFHKLKGSARFEQLNRSDPPVHAALRANVRRRSRCVRVACKCSSRRPFPALRAKVRRRFRCVRGWVAPYGLQGMRVRGLPPQSTRIGTATQSTQIRTAPTATQIGTATGQPRVALSAALGAAQTSTASAATASSLEAGAAGAAGAGAAAASCELEESYGVSLPKLEPCCEGWQLCEGEEDVEALEDGTWALRYPNSIVTA